ncbi:MAG: glycoside hydrolase family 3 C-terminal domain-containing protein [Vallitaleaceae bacterium]|nr:glycoside hydrolase family 3 C-terminal domain-containing protein [Vallitaleaceae bacterium]
MDISIDIKKIVKGMSLKEKAYMLTGKDFWRTVAIERDNIPSMLLIDGPHGLRKQVDKSDHMGINEAQNAICFPTASAIACSFDADLIEHIGSLLGEEAQAENVAILLGPGNNIKRSPLCGRNFEYFSEDPFLAGKLAAAHIRGVQSQGIGTSLKHFVANNQEQWRTTINVKVDERTLREIYLTAFEIPVREASPWTVMCSYNRINGTYLAENKYLLNDILRDEWGFDGFVVSDWGASDELARSVEAGMNLEMPSSGTAGPEKVIKAVKKGKLDIQLVDLALEQFLRIIKRVRDQKRITGPYDKDAHHHEARMAARECMVLLKNEDSILPMDMNEHKKIALLGQFASDPRFQGGGSSHINPYQVDTILSEFTKNSGNCTITYAQGYDLHNDLINEALIEEAVRVANDADIAVVCVGLIDDYETEALDRTHLDMPPNHIALIEAISKVNNNIVVVLSNGSPVKMPFALKSKAILETWLTGQAGASAIVDVLTGVHNPSGKLAETFINDEKDDPSFGNFPGSDGEVVYSEGIFIGYRHHDKELTDVLFPFGYGLSYTTYEYSNMRVDKTEITEADTVEVFVDVTNTGLVAGKEIVQLYVSEVAPMIERPLKELKGFAKVELQPRQTKTVSFTLSKRSFAFYHVDLKDWCIGSEVFNIMIGKSVADIVLERQILIKLDKPVDVPKVKKVYRHNVRLEKTNKITRNTYMAQLKDHPVGKRVYREAEKRVAYMANPNPIEMGKSEGGSNDFNMKAIEAMIYESPLRNMVNMSGGEGMSEKRLTQLIRMLNWTRKDKLLGRLLSGIIK